MVQKGAPQKLPLYSPGGCIPEGLQRGIRAGLLVFLKDNTVRGACSTSVLAACAGGGEVAHRPGEGADGCLVRQVVVVHQPSQAHVSYLRLPPRREQHCAQEPRSRHRVVPLAHTTTESQIRPSSQQAADTAPVSGRPGARLSQISVLPWKRPMHDVRLPPCIC